MSDYTTRRTTMVDTQIRPADITKFPIIEAMLSIRREMFVLDDQKEAAYADALLSLGGGRHILEPRTFGKMLDSLDIQGDELVLDLGCGIGYSSAVLGHFAEAVVGIEENEDLATEAETVLASEGVLNVAVLHGKLANGAGQHAPFDVIILQGAVEEIPQILLEQLNDGGRIAAIFNQRGHGVVRIGYKTNGHLSWRFAFNAFSPLLPGFEKYNDFTL